MLIKIVSSILLSCLTLPTLADDLKTIDKETEVCIDKNPSTSGMQQCHQQAYKKWDKQLNKVYKTLSNAQDKKEAKDGLKAAQLQWLKFRNSELKFIRKIYESKNGTYWGIVAGEMKIKLVKGRILALQAYLPEKL